MKYENAEIYEKDKNTSLEKYNGGNNKKEEGFLQKIKNTTLIKKLKSIKNIELIIAVVIVAVMLLIYASTLNKTNVSNTEGTQNTTEERLQKILEEIKGAGKVKVMIYYDNENNQSNSTTSTIFGNNETTKTTATGKIKGVIIVAEGANDIGVRLSLIEATKTALAIEYSEIEIFKMRE